MAEQLAALKRYWAFAVAILLSGAASGGGIYTVAADYNKDITELRVQVAVTQASCTRNDRDIEKLWAAVKRP